MDQAAFRIGEENGAGSHGTGEIRLVIQRLSEPGIHIKDQGHTVLQSLTGYVKNLHPLVPGIRDCQMIIIQQRDPDRFIHFTHAHTGDTEFADEIAVFIIDHNTLVTGIADIDRIC